LSIFGGIVRRLDEKHQTSSTPEPETAMTRKARKLTNGAVWTAQSLLALLFIFAGTAKFLMPADKLQQGPIALPLGFIYFIGAMEILGGFGLVLPGLFRIRTELTTFAAIGLLTIMSGAATISIAGMGVAAGAVPAVVGVIAATIAYTRARVVPLAA
jgi:uncharacterized membrane protein YphA (DoxX/SURF4 family)